MATPPPLKKYLSISVILHSSILLVLILGLDVTSPLAVFENTNQHDVISAVVLGDSAKSKILPHEEPNPLPAVTQKKELNIKPEFSPQDMEKDIIAIKKAEKKRLKRQQDLFTKALLADIKKTHDKQEKLKQKQLAAKFQKTLKQQAEKSLRQHLLNEEIKLSGTESRQSQGEVNKYKALILQAISAHWIIPSNANKKLFCQLLIRLAPGGTVIDVQVIRSSGDPSLDSSARAAVMKASPLPVPNVSDEFAPFRQFVLKVKPENVVSSDNIMGTF